MKRKPKVQRQGRAKDTDTPQQRRDIVIYAGYAESSIGVFLEASLDERLSDVRDILHEISRDGAICGKFAGDFS